jgi:hypothetical protein
MVSAMMKNRFTPTVSDRTGGILQAQHGGLSKYRGAKSDMNAFTVNRSNFWTNPEAFMVQGAGVNIVPVLGGCQMTVEVQYAALKASFSEGMANAVSDAFTKCRLCPSTPLAKNWILLQSNGKLESMIIAETEHLIGQVPALPQAPAPVSVAPGPVQPVTLPAPVVKLWEVVSADANVADNNGSVCHLAYHVSVKNNTDKDMVFSGSIVFLSSDGSTVDTSSIAGLHVGAHTEHGLNGEKMMVSDEAQKVVKTKAELTAN